MAAANCLLVCNLVLLGYVKFKPDFFVAGIINSGLSVVLVYVLLYPLETLFSRVTNIKLLELADFNQPLLKRLMEEAPGTYHHSLTVASIAEKAADAVTANSLLVRVAAYYHDIGKLIKPEYFIENQKTNTNPHDAISPSMSGIVVIAHVKEGVALAKKFNLDNPIIEFIEQHHGTSLLQIFYRKSMLETAAGGSGAATVSEHDFRYPGPKPTTRESVILMLADSCEAATRSLEEVNMNKITDMVEKIVNEKFNDGQFDDTQMTFFDLDKIKKSIVNSLVGIHHVRLEYANGNAAGTGSNGKH
jgi:hypothetical protein